MVYVHRFNSFIRLWFPLFFSSSQTNIYILFRTRNSLGFFFSIIFFLYAYTNQEFFVFFFVIIIFTPSNFIWLYPPHSRRSNSGFLFKSVCRNEYRDIQRLTFWYFGIDCIANVGSSTVKAVFSISILQASLQIRYIDQQKQNDLRVFLTALVMHDHARNIHSHSRIYFVLSILSN